MTRLAFVFVTGTLALALLLAERLMTFFQPLMSALGG